MGTILKGLQRIPWGTLEVPRGSARDIPGLLSKAAWADRENGDLALDRLADLVCELGFVISEATAPTVPFLLELAGAPQVACKAETLKLLLNIYSSQEWSRSAAGALPKYADNYTHKVQWENDAHRAVLDGRHIIEGLADSVDPDVAEAATKLLEAFAAEEGR
ncbi:MULTISPECIES: hypothetical protein [Streptomyces]|uniref:hypothetical protein n=1 Tax=Streptomyces TaxID=1883 RepID=UPI001587832D|nr:hypothetical protein [Streptomyces sp. CAI-85]MBO7935622.1 hypothetical protein [Streptomyces sp. S9]NUV60800.1 hypothetical protein [Streptomyces sp. CAI-85]